MRSTTGLPPAGGKVAATIENLCTSNPTHRRGRSTAKELTSGTGCSSTTVVCGSGLAALNTTHCQPAKDATHEDQPHASILTRPAARSSSWRSSNTSPGSTPRLQQSLGDLPPAELAALHAPRNETN